MPPIIDQKLLMNECIDKNMIDKDEYPQTAEIEARCVHMLANLWNSPTEENAIGCSTNGSSEAAMLGGMPNGLAACFNHNYIVREDKTSTTSLFYCNFTVW